MKFQISSLTMPAVLSLSWIPPAWADGYAEDATIVNAAVNTAGTVRVCNLANLEAFLNLLANGIEVTGIVIGCFLLVKSLTKTQEPHRKRTMRALTGTAVMVLGLLTPGAINWCVAAARDANLFS